MNWSFLYSLSALIALVPGVLLLFYPALAGGDDERAERPKPLFWLMLAVGLCGVGSHGLAQLASGWNAAFAQALWLSITITLVLFLILCLLAPLAWRLGGLLFGYTVLLALLAVVWSQSGSGVTEIRIGPWLAAHIFLSLGAYGCATLAAISAASVTLQERALKKRQPSQLVRSLPPILDAERWQIRFLIAAEVILLASIASGIAQTVLAEEGILRWDHKSIFSWMAFVFIGLVLLLHLRVGLRGRIAARFVLMAYLFLTLAYPGVKFVLDILLV